MEEGPFEAPGREDKGAVREEERRRLLRRHQLLLREGRRGRRGGPPGQGRLEGAQAGAHSTDGPLHGRAGAADNVRALQGQHQRQRHTCGGDGRKHHRLLREQEDRRRGQGHDELLQHTQDKEGQERLRHKPVHKEVGQGHCGLRAEGRGVEGHRGQGERRGRAQDKGEDHTKGGLQLRRRRRQEALGGLQREADIRLEQEVRREGEARQAEGRRQGPRGGGEEVEGLQGLQLREEQVPRQECDRRREERRGGRFRVRVRRGQAKGRREAGRLLHNMHQRSRGGPHKQGAAFGQVLVQQGRVPHLQQGGDG